MIRFAETYAGKETEFFEKRDSNADVLNFKLSRDGGARMIFDKNTGLFWEIKSASENDVNFCGDKYTFEEAKTVYTDRLNSEKYGGFSDWRIPNKDELRSIIDYGIDGIAVDTSIFENCQVGDYWTRNTYQMQPYFGWVIFFGLGSGIAKSKTTKRYVIACRGGKSALFGEADASRFIDNDDGTITDTATGIMWQKGENPRANVFSADEACRVMTLGGYKDWRLPNIKELNTILNLDYTDKWWYFKSAFPADGLQPPLLHYFSSSEFMNKYAWVTNFCFGYDGYYGGKNAPLLYRACRSIDADDEKFKLPHTGETQCFDVEGNGIGLHDDAYAGLDATRVTFAAKYSPMYENRAVYDCNTALLWQINPDDSAKYTYDEACAAIRNMNAERYLGFSDWRIPSREELRTIVNYDDCIPAIDNNVFTDTRNSFYWASERNKAEANSHWGIYFTYGCAISYPAETKGCLRAVRGKNVYSAAPEVRFKDNGDGTVTDKVLGLMWISTEQPMMTLREALKYCRELDFAGYTDWSLPNMKELGSIINLLEGDAWFYKSLFPDTNTKPQGFYMASTTFDATFGWGCNFQFGFDGYYADRKNGRYPFRPVRNINEVK